MGGGFYRSACKMIGRPLSHPKPSPHKTTTTSSNTINYLAIHHKGGWVIQKMVQYFVLMMSRGNSPVDLFRGEWEGLLGMVERYFPEEVYTKLAAGTVTYTDMDLFADDEHPQYRYSSHEDTDEDKEHIITTLYYLVDYADGKGISFKQMDSAIKAAVKNITTDLDLYSWLWNMEQEEEEGEGEE
jgi:hypothetical protein